ncbi:TPA: phage baseplate assembly protein V [Salmonella enterica]|nr:phage baseplate assembly protein V [Salmonella enterica subsp. enterica serovar Kentucky]HAF1675179.1 phage baseplate assembly protein V [Salmonella enterica]
MWNRIDARINGALNRIRMAFRGVLIRVNSGGDIQTVQGKALATETLQDVEMFQQYGFTSSPPKGTKAIMLPLNGKTSHSIVIATEHAQYRLKNLKSGELAIYTDEGSHIILKRGKIIEVSCDEYIVNAKNKFQVNTVDFDITATNQAKFETPLLKGSDEISDGKSTMTGMRDIYDNHTHHHGGDAGTTEKPDQPM